MMTIEEMEAARSKTMDEYIRAIGTPQEKVLLKTLDLFDEILDAMDGYAKEEDEEETDTSTHWDEYMMDLRIDLDMDRAMMAYER